MTSNNTKVVKRVLTPIFRMSYPTLITPEPYKDERGKPTGDPRYSLDMIYEPADIAKFRTEGGDGQLIEVGVDHLAVAAAKERWPELAQNPELLRSELKNGWPLIPGDKIAEQKEAKKKDGAPFRGKVLIRAKSYEAVKPLLSYFDKNADAGGGKRGKFRLLSRSSDVDMKIAEDLFQGGHYAGAELSLMPTEIKNRDGSTNKFITFYINAVRFVKEGERFGGKGMMDRFDGVYGGQSEHDPMAGMSTDKSGGPEIPF